jgi:hypothetical protein
MYKDDPNYVHDEELELFAVSLKDQLDSFKKKNWHLVIPPSEEEIQEVVSKRRSMRDVLAPVTRALMAAAVKSEMLRRGYRGQEIRAWTVPSLASDIPFVDAPE